MTRKSIFLFALGSMALASAIGCGSSVVRSGVNGTASSTGSGAGGGDDFSTAAVSCDSCMTSTTGYGSGGAPYTDATTGVGGYGGYYSSTTSANPTGGEGGAPPCDDETTDCGVVVNGATITKWSEVPQPVFNSGSSVSTSTGGGPAPDDLFVEIGAPNASCALPYGDPNVCTDYDHVSFTIHPSELFDGNLIDLGVVGVGYESIQMSDCSGGGGTIFSGTVLITIKPNGDIHLTLDNFDSMSWNTGYGVLYDNHYLVTKCFSFGQ